MSNTLRIVERANRALAASWRRGVLAEPPIEARAIERAALRGKPATAFGPGDQWREPFERLVTAVREEADLNPLGRSIAYGQLVMLLRSRIRGHCLARKRPQLIERDAAPPIVILGQMRSGTTRMQRLLACDRRFAHTRAYETLMPIPVAGRRIRARLMMAALTALNPKNAQIHPSTPDAPDEEIGLLAYAFHSAQFEAQWRIPSYARWRERADARPLFDELKRLLLINAGVRRDCPSKPWILKTPDYLQDLDGLLDTFPGARLIWLHRRPEAVVPSAASLVWNQMRIQSDTADKAWIGREWLRKTRVRDARAREALAARPETPVLHVDYDAMSKDWRGQMGRVYDFIGHGLSDKLIATMSAWLGASRSHIGHRYSLEEFGLTASDLGDLATAQPR